MEVRWEKIKPPAAAVHEPQHSGDPAVDAGFMIVSYNSALALCSEHGLAAAGGYSFWYDVGDEAIPRSPPACPRSRGPER